MPKKAQNELQRRLVIIDGNAIVHRCFHALPPLSTKDGVLVNAVYGFITLLFKVIKELKPTHIAATFDLPGPTFRHEAYAEYKATRVKQPDELYAQLPIVKDVLRAAGIKIFEAPGYEADDVIGTIAELAKKEPHIETIIVTGDMDTLQLVDGATRVFTMRKGVSDTMVYDESTVAKRYGLAPTQMIDYKALRGDPSDNILGVKGIGEKTATELIAHFGNLNAMYEVLERARNEKKVAEGVSARVQRMLLEQKDSALQSRELVRIIRTVPLKFGFEDCAFHGIYRAQVFPIFQHLQFMSLLSRLPDGVGGANVSKYERTQAHICRDASQTRDLVDSLKDEERVAVYLAKAAQQDLFGSGSTTFGFAWNKGSAAVELRGEDQWDELGRFFTRKTGVKIAHDVKQIIHELANHGITIGGEFFDVMVAAYVLQAGTRAHDLPNLVITLLGEDLPIEAWSGSEGQKVAANAERIFLISEKLRAEIEEKKLTQLFSEIEMPLILPLARMERYGVEIDRAYLQKLHKKLSKELGAISKKIYKASGREFNISSPQQVKQVLFEELGVSPVGVKRGKTGLSTAAGELEKLKGQHSVIDSILEHREIAKLLNTYVDALPKLIATDGRVHTSFNQVVTATGRLSSSGPNLQNIPVRTELGRDIRRAFVSSRGFTLLSCDYSQIELRIVAHLAQDEKLIDFFNRGLDIHRATAAEIHGVPLEEVTKEQRAAAKEVNFGVLYGMGSFGLAERTGISRPEASAFIEQYFSTFSGVARYVERTKVSARKTGYVETMFGRCRFIPEIKSGVPSVRAAAERMAVNMPVQGTAADLMKKAMIAVDEYVCREFGCRLAITDTEKNTPVKLLIQVHDELIFEVKDSIIENVASAVAELMAGVVKLDVPIVVDSATGENWAELE